MNELQRQSYISALGIDSYMPRWRLLQAPEPVACSLPLLSDAAVVDFSKDFSSRQSPAVTTVSPIDVSSLLQDMALVKKPAPFAVVTPSTDALNSKPRLAVEPFSLSIWRPASGFLVLDVRETGAALPTEFFLNQLLRACGNNFELSLDEEVLRWPMVENRFVSRTPDDARAELQTWLAVEHELRPINRLWLMGYNAAAFIVTPDTSLENSLFSSVSLSVAKLSGLYLPSLSELLQQPLRKALLWQALRDELMRV